MFWDDKLIIKLGEVDPSTITDESLQALNLLLTERQELVHLAKEKRSFAYQFFFLALTFQ